MLLVPLALIFLNFVSLSICCAHNVTVSLQGQSYVKEIGKYFSDRYLLESLECDPSVGLYPYEMEYLLGISRGEFFTGQIITEGLKRVQYKNLFSALTLEKEQGKFGTIIRVSAERHWILRTLRILGISFDKQRYYPLYEIASGEAFSMERHERSLQSIEAALKKEGYLVAKVSSYFEYYPEDKALDVAVVFDRGPLFKITYSGVSLACSSVLIPSEVEKLSLVINRRFLATLSGKPYGSELIAQKVRDIKKFLEEKGFFACQVEVKERLCLETKRIHVAFVVDLDKSTFFEFLGNQYLSLLEIHQMVSHFGQDTGMLPPQIIVQELLAEYQKRGFWKASIDTVIEDQKTVFMIKEGERAVIQKISFKGIDFKNHQLILKRFFSSVIGSFYNQQTMQNALDDLLVWYKKQGFWDVGFLQRKYVPLDNKNYALELVVDQGKQRFLAEVQVVGHESFGDLVKVGKPVPFSFDLLAQQELVIFNRMRALGFLYPKIKYELKEGTQGYRVIWHIQPGVTVAFGKTIVRGYTTVPTELLHKALNYKVGDLWDKEKVQISLGNLRSLDIFERVSLQAIHTGKKQSVRDLLLTVQEDDPFEVKVRLGYQQMSKNFAFKKGSSYKIGSTLVWKNPLKKADSIVVDVNVTRFERGISCSYRSPFLFDAPFSTLIKGYAHTYTQPVSVGSNNSLYEAVQQGFLVGLSSRQKKHINTSCSIGFEWMETKNLSEQLAQAMHFKTDLIDKKIPYFFIEPTIFLDLLNDKLNPTKGFFLLGTVKGMLPLKESSYSIKLLLEEGTFVPLGPMTFAHRIRFGHIFRKDFSAIMPPERFYLGGANSLRGYQTDKCPPLGSFLDEAGITQWVAQGGKSMLNVNLEMRVPLGNRPLYGVLFQDFGVLVEDIHTLLSPKKPLAATGIGFRYVTPVGPLRFDIGWKWHKQTEQESSYAWFLTFGHAF